jgi:undecaprenyl-diphosphatase
MSLWQALVLGAIQGLTEFIPISSTAHLTIAGKIMGLVEDQHPEEWTAFIAVIQLGTLLAVVLYFLPDIVNITRGFILANLAAMSGHSVDDSDKRNAHLGWLIIVGTLPIAIVGLLFRHVIEGRLTKNLWVIAGSMVGLAMALTIAEIVGQKRRGMERLSFSDAIIVGTSQVFALIPGSSRSGTTITGALFAGLTREAAARFSFLLSIPTIAASGLFELPKALHSIHTGWAALAISTLVSALLGYISIAFLLRYLQRHSTFLFVGYRIVLGLILLLLLATHQIGA